MFGGKKKCSELRTEPFFETLADNSKARKDSWLET